MGDVELLRNTEEVRVHAVAEAGVTWTCSHCGHPSPGYDSRRHQWRHRQGDVARGEVESGVARGTIAPYSPQLWARLLLSGAMNM